VESLGRCSTLAQDVFPTDATLEIFDLDGIPLFNEDDERTIMGASVGVTGHGASAVSPSPGVRVSRHVSSQQT